MDWRDISTAPRDGSAILLWGSGLATIPVVAEWALWHDDLVGGQRVGWREVGSSDQLYGASHWMPLPPPPEDA